MYNLIVYLNPVAPTHIIYLCKDQEIKFTFEVDTDTFNTTVKQLIHKYNITDVAVKGNKTYAQHFLKDTITNYSKLNISFI